MKLEEYLSVRYAHNLVRQETPSDLRLTFEEFSILCLLSISDEDLMISKIASYQGAILPTMTHRLSRLHALGLIRREAGAEDRRVITCGITDKGIEMMTSLIEQTLRHIPKDKPLARSSITATTYRVAAMGSLFLSTSDLVLLAMLTHDFEPIRVTDCMATLGLLQPTISMAVTQMLNQGLIVRERVQEGDGRWNFMIATDKGMDVARELGEQVSGIVIRRPRRAAQGDAPASDEDAES